MDRQPVAVPVEPVTTISEVARSIHHSTALGRGDVVHKFSGTSGGGVRLDGSI